MNHYPHHVGDFNNATRHLTRVERSLYRDLMDVYYDTEQPLPGDDFERLAKRVLARSDEEKTALQAVLNEFFSLENGVYRNARCDREIEKYQAIRDAASRAGKVSAQKRMNAKATGVKRSLKSRSTNQNQNQNQVTPIPPAFKAFWEAWPRSERKQAQGKCYELWVKSGFDGISDRILSHVDVLKKSDGWKRGFIPAPLVYLRDKRWEGADTVFEPQQKKAAI